ncbi:hypothetical protein JTE90_006310 [Oedothorax gibbosus]|nr:hypothetical protein JTE90_006310 [Oedothorax gibbosus]
MEEPEASKISEVLDSLLGEGTGGSSQTSHNRLATATYPFILSIKDLITNINKRIDGAYAQIRLNTYKAVANPTYICQVTDDPILYCFEIDKEMETCFDMDKEFKVEYEQLGTEVRDFTVQLLSQCRDTTETEMFLRLLWGFDEGGPKIQFPRVQLALDYKQR